MLTVLPTFFTSKGSFHYIYAADYAPTSLDEFKQRCLNSLESTGGTVREVSFIESIRRGDWECAKMIVGHSVQLPAIDYRKIIDVETRLIEDQLDNLKKAISSLQVVPVPSINCPFKWAQSPTEIILSVKFSHKIDAPATLNVVAKNVSLTSERLLLLASDGKKNFHLDIEFLGGVVPDQSTWSMASVGRMSFNIKKADNPTKWTGLIKGNRKLPQMHSWWEMQDKFEAELDELEKGIIPKLDSKKEPIKKVETVAGMLGNLEDTLESVDTGPQMDDSSIKDTEAGLPTTEKGQGSVTSEEVKRKVEDRKIEDQHRKKLSALTNEARNRKRDVDIQCKKDKALIDDEIATKLAHLGGQKSSELNYEL